jgi:hypothetical protein
MAVSCKVGAFSTGTGTSAFNVTCGFQPKFVIFWWSGHTSSTDSNTGGDSKYGAGFATDGSEHSCVTSTDDNGAGSQGSSNGARSDACIASLTVNSATWDGLIGIDALANWPSDGFRLTIADAMPIDLRVGFWAVGGADITDVDILNFSATAVVGSDVDITNSGFQPDVVFFLGSNQQAIGTALATYGLFSMGVATSATACASLTAGTDQGSASSDTAAYCLDAAEISSLPAASDPTSLITRLAFVQMNVDGFRYHVNELSQSGVRTLALCVKGGVWKVGSLATQTDTSTGIAISGLGGTPRGVLVASANRAESTQDAATAPWKTSLGAATSTTERHAQAVCSSSGDGNMRVVRAVEHDEIYVNITDPAADIADGAAGGTDGLMDVSSVDSDGFTFIMDDADPSAFFAWYVMAGEAAAGGPTAITATDSDKVQFSEASTLLASLTATD